MSNQYYFLRSSLLIVFLRSSKFLLIFCLTVLSITERRALKSPSIIVNWSNFFFSSVRFCCCYCSGVSCFVWERAVFEGTTVKWGKSVGGTYEICLTSSPSPVSTRGHCCGDLHHPLHLGLPHSVYVPSQGHLPHQ